jgi:hypothetical protein
MNSLTGQYECAHRSALGLDYFTARLDRLTLYASGRFALITQEKSRLMHAAKNLASGQQAGMEAPETKAEGSYSAQGDQLFLSFDSGEQQRATIQEAGLLFGNDFYEKVSDSTFMPPPQRMKSNMEDIAKGLKIAGAIGGTVFKAAKTIQGTIQSMQPDQSAAGNAPGATSTPSASSNWQAQPNTPPPASAPAQPQTYPAAPAGGEAYFCDQCGSPVRPGKKFCNKCGARLI